VSGVDSEQTEPAVSTPAAGAAPTVAHLTTIVEKGSFITAHCDCGWHAPARRSRDKSRKDAAQHLEQ
jgi:hypothetical protein